MSNQDKSKPITLGPGANRLADIGDELLDLLTDRVAARVGEGARAISYKDLRIEINRLKDREDQMTANFYQMNWQDMEEVAERTQWEKKRSHPLERLMINRFQPLFPGDGEKLTQGRHLSKRIIPAFVAAIRQMVGPELLTDYQERSKDLLEFHKIDQGSAFEWSHFEADPRSDILVNDILVYIARYFVDVERRRKWMQDLFLRRMPAPKTEEEQHWIFDDFAFHLLLQSLYADLLEQCRDKTKMRDLISRYGQANMKLLIQMSEAIAIDQRVITATAKSEYAV